MRKVGITVMLLCLMLTSGCGSLYASNKSGYTSIDTVEGVVFDIPTSLLSKATAVSMISEDETYDGLYIYKDGKANYYLFDMSSIVIACEKGTNYDFFETKEKAEALENSNIENIYLTLSEEKFDYETDKKDNTNKLIGEVSAEVSITPTQYGDFIGKIATVSDGTEEWSLFVGAKGSMLTAKQEKIINHVAKSLVISGEYEQEETEEATENKAEEITEKATEENVVENTQSVIKEEQNVITDAQSVINENTNGSPKLTEDEAESVITEVQDAIATASIYEEAKTSDIYNPLSLGDIGLTITTQEQSKGQITAVRADKIYRKEEAKALLDKWGITSEATDGMSYEVLEYSLCDSPTELYVNVKIEGLDGERLKYRGVSHTTRTYDYLEEAVANNGMYEKCYVYYEVPNGCKEYLLEFGDRVKEHTAFYKISR